MSVRSLNPGLLGSFSDFGYNGQGIMFNETTVAQQERAHSRIHALWSFWRMALAEFYADSLHPVPFGSVGAKIVSASMLLPYLNRSCTLEPGFW